MNKLTRWTLSGLAALVLLVTGCDSFNGDEVVNNPPPPPDRQVYSDFDDIRLPAEMTLDRTNSIIVRSGQFKAGVMSLKGSPEYTTLVGQVRANMEQDGWALLTSFRHKKEVLIYTKNEKICMILFYPSGAFGNTKVEIWVSPLSAGASSPDAASESGTDDSTEFKPAPVGGQTKTGLLPLSEQSGASKPAGSGTTEETLKEIE